MVAHPACSASRSALPLLQVERLSVGPAAAFRAGSQRSQGLLDGVSFVLHAQQRLAVVGASGAGKSLLAHALLGLLRPPLQVLDGRILWQGENLLDMPRARRHALRGTGQFLIFQSPGALLDPLLSVGAQLRQVAQQRGLGADALVPALAQVGLDARVLGLRAWQLSGGMKQRVLIAMALLLRPQLVLADEPSSALDPENAAAVMQALLHLQAQTGCALIFISHDLRWLRQAAPQVLVLEQGQVVENQPWPAFEAQPGSRAGQALLSAAHTLEGGS